MNSVSRASLSALLVALSLCVLSGCAQEAGKNDQIVHDENFQAPEAAPTYVEGGTAADNLPVFHEVLRQFALGGEAVKGEPIVNSLVSAGFTKETMQVSFDNSKTGLDADSIFVSARFGAECLVGQVTFSAREFASDLVPAVGPNDEICLIGNTRPIDW